MAGAKPSLALHLRAGALAAFPRNETSTPRTITMGDRGRAWLGALRASLSATGLDPEAGLVVLELDPRGQRTRARISVFVEHGCCGAELATLDTDLPAHDDVTLADSRAAQKVAV